MKRSEMREQAFLLTFEGLFSSGQDIDEVIELYSENVEAVSKYAKDVFVGVKGSKNELDEIINKYSKSWKAARLPKVTLAILYVALYEMKNVEDVADSIAINEAVELAKKYASSNDASYINGVLRFKGLIMYLGFDTSNYTTSVALFDGNDIIQAKKLLHVKTGERGLRQSDAVFQHTVNMPEILAELEYDKSSIDAVAVSTRPRNIEKSYMPCFMVGKGIADAVSKFTSSRLYYTSHQVGHILAALYSVGRLDLVERQFIAFHVSGGTTEALLVTPDKDEIIKAQIIAQSLDLKAGQAIDRTGVLLGLNFPCGKELDKFSLLSDKNFRIKPSMKGLDCSLSGIENKAKAMIENGESKQDISKFVLTYISTSLEKMTELLLEKYGDLPLVFAGGVMSNTLIKTNLVNKFSAYFAKPEFSCDNAAGIAIYAYLKDII